MGWPSELFKIPPLAAPCGHSPSIPLRTTVACPFLACLPKMEKKRGSYQYGVPLRQPRIPVSTINSAMGRRLNSWKHGVHFNPSFCSLFIVHQRHIKRPDHLSSMHFCMHRQSGSPSSSGNPTGNPVCTMHPQHLIGAWTYIREFFRLLYVPYYFVR